MELLAFLQKSQKLWGKSNILNENMFYENGKLSWTI